MKKKDVTLLSKKIEKKLNKRYKDPVLCNQYAWWILEEITNKSKAGLISAGEISFSGEQIITLDNWLKKLIEYHIPLQYLVGSVPFDNIEILVEPPTLIPRPETEEMCYKIIDLIKKIDDKKITILDIGTGTGCIAITLAKAFKKATIYATDISDKALELAKRNAKQNNINNVIFLKSDLYNKIPENVTFDFIVSNPPYINEEEWKTLDESVTKWEDKKALVAQNQGLAIIKKIITGANKFIKSNRKMESLKIPQLIIEIGYKQGSIVAELFKNAHFSDIVIVKDMEKKDRFVSGRISNVALQSKKT